MRFESNRTSFVEKMWHAEFLLSDLVIPMGFWASNKMKMTGAETKNTKDISRESDADKIFPNRNSQDTSSSACFSGSAESVAPVAPKCHLQRSIGGTPSDFSPLDTSWPPTRGLSYNSLRCATPSCR